jgi:hypothetical protein
MIPAIMKGFDIRSEQPPLGYVTLTTVGDDRVLYGIFTSLKEATEFGSNLVNVSFMPVYRPSLH